MSRRKVSKIIMQARRGKASCAAVQEASVSSNFIYHSGPPLFTPSLVHLCKMRHISDKDSYISATLLSSEAE